MTLIALLSLAFSGWMAWTLHDSIRAEKLSEWHDWLSAIWIGAGSLSGMIVSAVTIAKALMA